MKQWDQQAVQDAIIGIPECSIEQITLPEDYVTSQLVISVAGSDYGIFVRGFRTDAISPAKDDNRIEMVEVTTGFSDGDMPNDPAYCIVHARVKAALMTLGYCVTNSLDPYF